jgi:hypothetical protein
LQRPGGLADEGKGTLVFSTQRDHVDNYAGRIVDLTAGSFLHCVRTRLPSSAKASSSERLGAQHPAVKWLDVGVAIHHARLPNRSSAKWKRVLSEGVLKVTIASPTLAQGLNSMLPFFLFRTCAEPVCRFLAKSSRTLQGVPGGLLSISKGCSFASCISLCTGDGWRGVNL